MENINLLGAYPLFLGIESHNWSLAQFQEVAHNARALGCTSLLVKIADGGDVWFVGIGGWERILDTINPIIKAIPYSYCYGNKFGAIQAEIDILKAAMGHSGIVVADMESEFNGRVDWAQQICAALKPVQGLFGVSTWADPNLQNWQFVLQALKPCVNFWLPQVYSNYLASVYHAQFDPYGKPYYPTLNLGTDAGPNDILQIAKSSNSPIISFWEYQAAVGSYANTVKEIISMKGNIMGVPQGWSDDGHTLLAPSMDDPTKKIPVVLGFRDKILSSNWDQKNVPLGPENHVPSVQLHNLSLGPGQIQIFRDGMLWYTQEKGVVWEQYLGLEIEAAYLQISQLQSQLAANNQANIDKAAQSLNMATLSIHDALLALGKAN